MSTYIYVKEDVHLKWYCGEISVPVTKAVIEFIMGEFGALFEVYIYTYTYIYIYIYMYLYIYIYN
jgi:hypothetical protein